MNALSRTAFAAVPRYVEAVVLAAQDDVSQPAHAFALLSGCSCYRLARLVANAIVCSALQ
jgi:hypothetical protein